MRQQNSSIDASTISASFPVQSSTASGLLQIKSAYLKSMELIHDEVKRKRSSLASSLLRLKKSAFRLGFRAGLEAAKKDVGSTLDSAKQQYEKCLLQGNKDCLELALKIASEIMQVEAVNNTKGLAERIKRSLEGLINAEGLIINAHPAHHKELELIFNAYPKKVKIKPDAELEPGNAVITTSSGETRLNWRTQLEMMEQLLFSRIQSRLPANP